MSTQKERPIPFKAPMVQAILAGRKTQTRRVVKPPAPFAPGDDIGVEWATGSIKCPFGAPGDRLWLREAWRVRTWNCEGDARQIEVDYRAGDDRKPGDGYRFKDVPDQALFDRLYAQSVEDCEKAGLKPDPEGRFLWSKSPCRWRPSIFMPRWACRIILEVTDIRVEPLQNITEADAQAEGVELHRGYWLGGIHPAKKTPQCWPTATMAFSKLWDSTYAKRGYGWDENPWVWAVTFKKMEARR